MSTKNYIDEHEFKEYEIDIEKEKSFMESNRSFKMSPKANSKINSNYLPNGVIVEEKEKETILKEGGEIDSDIFKSKVSIIFNIEKENQKKYKSNKIKYKRN